MLNVQNITTDEAPYILPHPDSLPLKKEANYIFSRIAKYSSRLMPALLKLFLIMKTGTSCQSGITMGRTTPAFVYTKWSPSILTQVNPAFPKTFRNLLEGIGVIRGTYERLISSVAISLGGVHLPRLSFL